MSTITIGRVERDLIRQHAEYWMWVDDAIPFGDHAEATETIRKLLRLRTFYDELGWNEDDAREEFVVTVDESLSEVLREGVQDAKVEIERQTDYRETHILKLRPTRFGTSWEDDFPTIEDANAKVDACIREAEEQQHACEDLLERLDARAATA